jgi:cyclopropane-fatty-acyl-phospholipid synthase
MKGMSALLRRIFDRVAGDQPEVLRVVFADGEAHQNRPGPPDCTVVFRTRGAELATLALGYVGLFEAYFDGRVDFEGDRPVSALMRMAYRGAYTYTTNPLVWAARRWREWRDSNRDRETAKRNAIAHYGLPHAFFRLMLGEDCLYAEGFWPPGIDTLAEAQRARCERICRKLRLRPGLDLVEVGSGWGYQAVLAAERYGVNVVNYGLVPAQNVVMQRLIDARGLGGRVRIVERDHRDLATEPERYDRYLSVGVYEHAGRPCQDEWIASIARALKPGGIGLISTTAYMRDYPTEYLTIRHVFPGGSVPSLPRLLDLLDRHGLRMVEIEELGRHYQRTAECWLANLEARWPEIAAIDPAVFTERFRRIWTYYLAGVIEGFRPRGGGLDLHHVVFTKGASPDWDEVPRPV